MFNTFIEHWSLGLYAIVKWKTATQIASGHVTVYSPDCIYIYRSILLRALSESHER
jgi:hypothetical protein